LKSFSDSTSYTYEFIIACDGATLLTVLVGY